VTARRVPKLVDMRTHADTTMEATCWQSQDGRGVVYLLGSLASFNLIARQEKPSG